MSPDQSTISVRRGTANWSRTSRNSSRDDRMIRSRDPRISRYSLILPASSSSSSVTSLTPIWVRRCRAQFKDRAGLCFGQVIGAVVVGRVGRIVDQAMYSQDFSAGQRRVISFSRASAASAEAGSSRRFRHICDRHGQTAQDVAAFARLAQSERGAAGHNVFAEIDERRQEAAQRQLFGRPPFSASMLQPK